MPRLNGLEGTRQLLKTNPEANIGAELLLSFYSFSARRRRSDAPGFFTASFVFPQVFCNLPSTCLTAPFAWFFSSPVHSPTCRWARPAMSFVLSFTLFFYILFPHFFKLQY